MLILNNVEIDNGADRRTNDAMHDLQAPAMKPAPKVQATSTTTIAQRPGAEAFMPRSGKIIASLRNQASYTAKHAALASLAASFVASEPATIVWQGRMLCGVSFQDIKPIANDLANTDTSIDYEILFVAKDPFWYDLAPWAVMGYTGNGAATLGSAVGLTVGHGAVDTSQPWVKVLSSGATTMYNPGSGCAYAVGSVSIGGAYTGTLYLKSDKGARYTAIQITNGSGVINLSDRLYLAPGSNTITAYTLLGGVYSVYTAQAVTLNLGLSRFRWLGFDGLNATLNTQDGYSPPVVLHRTGSKTYIPLDGTLSTATDGQVAIGLPNLVRRNLLSKSQDFSDTSLWVRNASNVTVALGTDLGPDGLASAATITQTAGFGFRYADFTVTPSSTYTLSWYARKGTMTTPKYSIFNVTGAANIVAATAYPGTVTTSALSRVTTTFTTPAGCTSVRLVILDGASGGGTITLTAVQLEPGSTATPYQATTATGVDITNSVNGAGMVLEGGTTNRLSSNVATGTDTSAAPTGFQTASSWYVATGAAISSDTTQAFQGTRSLKVVAPGSAAGEGVETAASAISGLAANTTYTGSVRVKGTAGQNVRVSLRDYTNSVSTSPTFVTLTGGWDYVSVTVVTGGTVPTDLRLGVQTNGTAATTFWLDTLQVEAGPFPTSWVDGTRSADLCGIVPLHNLLKYSEQFDNATWNASGVGVMPNNTAAPDGTATADKLTSSAGDGNIGQTANGVVGKTYTFSVWLRSDTPLQVYIIPLDAGGAITLASCNLTTTWQRFSVTGTVRSGSVIQGLIGGSSSFTSGEVIYAWGAQLVEGSHPGVYVRTTDTPTPAPAPPALDPAWMQNGSITFTVVLPSGNPAKSAGILGAYNDPNNVLNFFHNNLTGLVFNRRSDKGLASQVITTSTINDGAPHAVKLEHKNYIDKNGVRSMPVTLTIDGSVVATYDAAVSQGATSWLAPDPTTLISDGGNTAVISNLRIEYLPPPSGAIAAT